MKGDYIRKLESHYWDGKTIIDSNQWYKIIKVFEDGSCVASPDGSDVKDVRIFYLCAVNENEIV